MSGKRVFIFILFLLILAISLIFGMSSCSNKSAPTTITAPNHHDQGKPCMDCHTNTTSATTSSATVPETTINTTLQDTTPQNTTTTQDTAPQNTTTPQVTAPGGHDHGRPCTDCHKK